MDGTTGRVAIIPGVGSAVDAMATQTGTENNEVAYFTNPRGVYNKFTGLWDVPDGRSWNGRFCKPTKKNQKTRQSGSYHGGKRGSSEKRGKVRIVQSMADSSEESDSDGELPQPKAKKRKAAKRKTKAPTHSAKDEPQMHPEAKARNDAYLATRTVQSTSATGNDGWA
ncbi:hypothetical protein PInf_023333 [Phytophthora infestans]|nr:hypothetical protein PInf_023333 [Phytophthora infestans]